MMPILRRSPHSFFCPDLGALDASEERQATLDDLDRRAIGQPANDDRRFNQLADEIRLSDVVAATLGEQTRGDFVARWQAWQIAIASGVLDPDEIRVAEGWGPRTKNDLATGENVQTP